MSTPAPTFTVRPVEPTASIIAILGKVTIDSEEALMAAYAQAQGPATRTIILDFTGLDYINSGGIGLLVMLLIRMQRQGQRLMAFGLRDHERRIFAMTKLDDSIRVCDSEDAALAAARGA